MSTKELQDKIVSMAGRREAKGNFDVSNDCYIINLHDMAYEDELSYPAYLLLQYCWNDALDWAKDPSMYVIPPKESIDIREEDSKHIPVLFPRLKKD